MPAPQPFQDGLAVGSPNRALAGHGLVVCAATLDAQKIRAEAVLRIRRCILLEYCVALRIDYSSADPPTFRTARNASCGMSTLPTRFMRRLPSFCFSSSLRLREMSPP
jgi:hypothetical protein